LVALDLVSALGIEPLGENFEALQLALAFHKPPNEKAIKL
jgi:hypothetical protein